MNLSTQFSLTGKTALVTGCKRGIGRAMAVGLAEAGADIIGVSRRLSSTHPPNHSINMALVVVKELDLLEWWKVKPFHIPSRIRIERRVGLTLTS